MKITTGLTSFCLAALGMVASAGSAAAQDLFYATINGANETPPNASPAIGRGWFNFDRASSTIWYKVESNVAVGTASHIHKGAPGVAGPIIFPLVGGPANYEGVTPALTPAQIQDLYNGQYYVNIHSVAFPGGEIRGQLTKVFTRRTFASLSGLSEVPPTPSAGAGTATVILHEPSHVITYQMKVGGLTSMPTGAHIHTGPVGVNGPITVILNGGATGPNSGEWCGTAQLSAADASLLITSGMYVNVHTVIFAGGEVRGQLMPQKEEFASSLNGLEETPPNASPNTGFGTFVFDPTTNQVAYNVTWTGATGTMSHVHTGIPLVAGAILFGLAGPANGPYAGISPALTSVAVADMFNLRHYTNIHSVPFPGGETRGQNRQNPSLFGYPGVTSAGPLGRVLRIGASGSPVLGGTWIATVHDAMPGAFVSLAYAQDLVGMPLDLTIFGFPNEVLWVDALTGYPTSADPNGCASISFAVPPFPFLVGNAFYFQWVSIEGGSLVMSDAMQVWVH